MVRADKQDERGGVCNGPHFLLTVHMYMVILMLHKYVSYSFDVIIKRKFPLHPPLKIFWHRVCRAQNQFG
jgi:hypothetical protein